MPTRPPARVIEPHGRHFEDFRLDEVIRHATPRTLTEGDAAVYGALTGSRHAIWSCARTARALGLARRPLHDLLVFNVAFGKTVPDVSQNAVANLGYAEARFLAPVHPGDTLRSESAVIGLRATSDGTAGVVYVRSTAYRDDDTAVLTWVRCVLVRRRDPGSRPPPARVPRLESPVPVERLPAPPLRPGAVLEEWCEATGSQVLWDDHEPGDVIVHPGATTIEEADHMSATRLYQNTARVHFDARAAAATGTGRRLVYGGHVISVCHALSHDGLENVLGLLAINAGRHVAPVVAGDTLQAATRVVERWTLPGRDDVGALRLRLIGFKEPCATPLRTGSDGSDPAFEARLGAQPGVVLDLDYTVLVPRRPAS